MKKLILTVLCVRICVLINAQCINTYPTLNTDPAVTNQQRNGQGKVNNFDWTRDIYDDVFITQSANGTNPICKSIYAPWNQINSRNPNVLPLIDQKLSNHPATARIFRVVTSIVLKNKYNHLYMILLPFTWTACPARRDVVRVNATTITYLHL